MRIIIVAVVAPAISMLLFTVLAFCGILFTTQGKQSAPSDLWVMFGSWAAAAFVGGLVFALIAGRFTMPQAGCLTGLYLAMWLAFASGSVASGQYGMAIVYQIPLALVVTALSLLAGGCITGVRKRAAPTPIPG